MRKQKLFLLVTMCVAFSGAVSAARAQASDKHALIAEFRKLTGANKVTGSLNFSPDGIRAILWAIVADDKELTEAQRESLRKSVDEATARVDKPAREFLNDTMQIAKLQEDVIFRIYDTSFTETELKELIAFYRTPTGQKAAVFLPALSNRVQTEFGPVIQQKLQGLIQPVLQAEREQLMQRIKDAKSKKESE